MRLQAPAGRRPAGIQPISSRRRLHTAPDLQPARIGRGQEGAGETDIVNVDPLAANIVPPSFNSGATSFAMWM
jgi:hypothetical protein